MSRHMSSFHEVESSPDGRYVRFDERLGTGAYKEVYLAYDTETGKEVAWNTVEMKRLPVAEKRRIRMETSILSRLHHPHIINFYTVWEQEAAEQIVFTTEIMTSGTLKQYTARLKQVKLKVVKKWCRQVLSALVYLHSHSPPIIHRDLKCDNIFINGSTGEVRIGDFGLSVARHATHVESVLGTPEFMAPELYDEKYSESVDCYAFGMSVLEMATKEYPYQECSNAAQIWKKVSSGQKPEVLTRIVDPQLRAFIDCCLLPADTRPSAAELAHHPFLAWKRSDPFRDGLLVVVEPKAGAAGKAGGGNAEEAERAVKEAERESRRREEDEDDRIRDRPRAQQHQQQQQQQQHDHNQQQQQQPQPRLEFRPSSSRPQPIDTETRPQAKQASPPSQLISPFTSPSPSPPLKRDLSVPSRLPSMLPPQSSSPQPAAVDSSASSPPPPAAGASPLAATPTPLHALPALYTSSSPTALFPPPLSSPQSAPPLDIHPPASGSVSAVMVDVDGRVDHVASVTLHIHFDLKRKKQIRFDYSLQDDTSVSLATEMVKALHLPDADRMIMIISTTLEERIDPYRRDWFDSMREGAGGGGAGGGAGDAATRLRTSGVLHPHPALPLHQLPSHGSPPPHMDYHPQPSHAQPQLGYYPPPLSVPPSGPHQQPHPQQAGRPTSSSAHHRYSPSTQLPMQQPAGSRASVPVQMSAAPYPRPPSFHTGAPHVSGSHSAASRGALMGEMRNRYQTLPQGFVFPQPGGGQPMTQAAIKSVQQHHQQQQQAQIQQQQQQQQQQQSVNGGALRLALGGEGARGRAGVAASPIGSGTPPLVSHGHSAAASSSTPPAVPYSRRSSMPLQAVALSVQPTPSPVVSPPALSPMSAAATSSPPLPLSPSAASSAVSASHPSSHADAWTAYYRSLSVALLKERVKLVKGAEMLSGALDKAELIRMLVDCTPSADWPESRHSGQSSPHAATSPLPHSPQPGDGKKRSSEDGRVSKDSRPSSRHSSHNESSTASTVSSAAAAVVSASSNLSPPTQPTPPLASSSLSPLAQPTRQSLHVAPPLSVSVSAAAEEWTDLAFDVVTKEAADTPEESKEVPHGRPSLSSTFRDLDPLFNSPARSAREIVALHAPPLPLHLDGAVPPLSSPASGSSGSSLYDFSISPSQPASSPFSASASFPGVGQRRPSLSFFNTAPVAGGVDEEQPAQHRRTVTRNSILDTASIDMLSEMVLGVGPGKGGLTWKGEEKENAGSSALRAEEEAAGK